MKSETQSLFIALLLAAVTTLAYVPALRGGFLWDDDAYISQNAELTSLQGLQHIWLKPGTTQQYYPLTFTAFWIEYHLWGLNPLGYHLVNVLLHGLNAILLWMILEGLGIPGAWIAAWLFALHPVQAESVAWMTELKNVLSTFFYLLTLLVLIRKRQATGMAPPAAALVFFFCALLSKSVTVTLPVSVLALYAWMKGRLDKKTFVQLLPFLATAFGAGLFTLYYEHHWVGAQGAHWDLPLAERLIIAGRAFWFYLGKLIYPSPIVFIYPRWLIDPRNWLLYFYPVTALAFLAGAAYGQKWWGKLPFAGLLFFVISLSPTLGLSSFYFMRYSFVADHFQYLASLGILSLAGWLIARALEELQVPMTSPLGLVVLAMLGVNLALMTGRAAGKYSDSARLWQETLRYNPYSAFAHHNLGIALSQRQDWMGAIAHFRTAEVLDPTYAQTHLALAFFAVHARRWEDARREYQEAFRLGIRDPQVLKDFAALPKPARAAQP